MARSAKVQDLYHYLCKFAPPQLAEEWDNVGLQLGSLQDTVTGVLVSLDVTEAVLWEAVEHNANLIVTHHPLFFRPVSRLDDSTVPTRLARLATQMDLNVLSFHTNLDATRQGLNDLLAKQLKLRGIQTLLPTTKKGFSKAGLGRVGQTSKTKLKDFLPKVGRLLKLRQFTYVGDLQAAIRKVAVMTGSGGAFFQEAKRAGADVLITGDVKYHHALDANAQGLAMIDIGHFSGEIGMVGLVAKKLRQWTRGKKLKLKITETKSQSDPLQFWHR